MQGIGGTTLAQPLSTLDKIRDSIEAQRSHVKAELRAYLHEMDPFEFEHLIRDLLSKMSFTDCEVTQKYKDGGIDLRANFSIGISEVKTLGQVKRHKAAVGTQALQQFYGAMTALMVKNEVHLGLFVTTSSFASSAVSWVEDSSLPLVLIDGDRLVDLLVENGLLVCEVSMPAALELVAGGQAYDQDEGTPELDECPHGVEAKPVPKHQFKWNLEMAADGHFVLRCNVLADPSKSFEVSGVRVPPDGDFKPARTQLNLAIADGISPLFPGLDKGHLHAKAWSGTHRVYPADTYG